MICEICKSNLYNYCLKCDMKDKTLVKTARIDEIIEEFRNDDSDNCDDIRKDIIEMLEKLKGN